MEFLEESLKLESVEERHQLFMRRSIWNYSERILHARKERHRLLRERSKLNYPESILQAKEESYRLLRERSRPNSPDTRHWIKNRRRRWYGKRIAELVEQDDAMDMRIQENILDITYEIEKDFIRNTERFKDAFLISQDMSWNIHTETEDVNLDNIHTSIQGAIVDIILDQKQAIKSKAVKAMYNEYPWYDSSSDDRRSPLAAIFKHLGDDDSDDSDDSD